MKYYVAPYKMGSESARVLARSLGALRTEGNKRYAHLSTFINWGNSSLSVAGRGVYKIYNKPSAVVKASNKLSTFTVFNQHKVPTLEYTQDESLAKSWLDSDGLVYGRSILDGSQGQGIKIITNDEYAFPYCKLYTRAVTNAIEFRVHVAGNKILDFTRKRKREGVGASDYIRNSANGWVFCRQEEVLPDVVAAAAIMGVAALGLDFGAADILYRKSDAQVFVLEVNTAPGIEGTTLDKYVAYFRGVL